MMEVVRLKVSTITQRNFHMGIKFSSGHQNFLDGKENFAGTMVQYFSFESYMRYKVGMLIKRKR